VEFINFLQSILGANTTPVIVVTAAGLGLAIVTLILDYRNERRASDSFGIERRRLSEVNLRIKHNVQLMRVRPTDRSQIALTLAAAGDTAATEPGGAAADAAAVSTEPDAAFMVLRMPMKNIGDGPIDILGMLASAKQMTFSEWERGIGARSRDVEWSDYRASFWNDEDLDGSLFAGISTTKSLVNTADNFNRLSAKESGAMRRLDAIHDRDALARLQTVNLMYRVFAVARGYSLGEILRQLGGGPPDPAVNARRELLQFQRLAQPNYRRWLAVQTALINLNRFAFRLAIFDPEHPEASQDPLGILVDPNAWRLFLLRHWEFVDDLPNAEPKRLPKKLKEGFRLPAGAMDRAGAIALELFPGRRLPDAWTATDRAKMAEARERCGRELAPFIAAWERLKQDIATCKANAFTGHVPRGCPHEGYPRMIHTQPEFRDRWYALMHEGYLVSKPFHPSRFRIGRYRIGWFRRRLSTRDIPADPRVLEPYVMRTYYFLDSVDVRPTSLVRNVSDAGATDMAGDEAG
jgi:hypothetical protein